MNKLEEDYQRVIEFLRAEAERNREYGRTGFAKVYEEHEAALIEYRRVMGNTIKAHQASIAAWEKAA